MILDADGNPVDELERVCSRMVSGMAMRMYAGRVRLYDIYGNELRDESAPRERMGLEAWLP